MKTHFHLIAIEETGDWKLENMDQIDTIEIVYLYDSKRVTHACEVTPSYELHPIETRGILRDEFDTDEIREELSTEILRECDSDVKYYHCKDVEKMVKELSDKPFRYKDLGEEEIDEEKIEGGYKCILESTIEYYRCNSGI